MAARTMREVTKALQSFFSSPKIPSTLPGEIRRKLQSYVDEYADDISAEESASTSAELKNFWERWVGENPSKCGPFLGVLRELRPVLVRPADILDWWQSVVKPAIVTINCKKAVLEDATEFVVGCMVKTGEDYDESGEEGESSRLQLSRQLLRDLISTYLARTRGLTEEDQHIAPDNAQAAQQVEHVLVAYGRKEPRELFHIVDDVIRSANTRLQGLTLLSSFLRHNTPHLYLVVHTPLVEDLLKCLMNDTSTTVLSVALTSLIMLLPHIPGSLGAHLPRLFLIYSRLLCWEKFSPLSTDAQRDLVTDDRLSTDPEVDAGDVGIDPVWEKSRPREGEVETSTPELMTYFTYLYGLYPLNFMSYVRKPRRYLKNCEFPGAEDFDLDQAVIRGRTDQFSQVHLCHPNMYNMTIEEELIDPKWPKMDPADVVAECHGLCVRDTKPALISPGPPPSGRLPEVPPLPPLANGRSLQLSPSASHVSLRSGNSWRDTQSTTVSAAGADGDSPVLRANDLSPEDRPQSKNSLAHRHSPSPEDFPQPGSAGIKESQELPSTNLAHLQRENTMLRNQLNFERWHKSQYSQHIGQMMRKNVKDATAEAETLNLINANRTLKLQLEQVRNAREATLKDSSLTRKQANSLEGNMMERFNNLRKEQETWRADAEELRRLRKETNQYRELLVATEARELNKSHQLEVVKRDLEQMQRVQRDLQEAKRRLSEYEYREFEMTRAQRELEIVQHEKEALMMRVKRHDGDNERLRRAYDDKIAELEAQLEVNESFDRSPGLQHRGGPDVQVLVQHAISESQAKLAQLKKKHNTLMEKHSDLELEYDSVKAQLDALSGNRQGHGGCSSRPSAHTFFSDHSGGTVVGAYDHSGVEMSGGLGNDSAYDTLSDYNGTGSDSAYTTSTSDPTSRRYQSPIRQQPAQSPRTEASIQGSAGLTWKNTISRQESLASRSSSQPATTFNQTAPLGSEDQVRGSGKSAFSDRSSDSGQGRKEKIKPDSQVRVYGRGGAQNIKLKTKEKDDKDKSEKPKGFRSLIR
ncbi:hypothetical protein KC333_g8501 [Hortaea werneckii]|nr:hypothetical protein KC333_g8501 [Hortaea werneckii]KAI7304065.1 hypothetical protein KC326_g8535 [Hortaea werneckii]